MAGTHPRRLPIEALDALGFGEWVGQFLMAAEFPFRALYV